MITLLIKRTNTPDVIPTAGQIFEGELILNTADGKLFTKKSSGEIVQFTTSSIIRNLRINKLLEDDILYP